MNNSNGILLYYETSFRFAALKVELQRIQEGFEIHTYFLIYKFAQTYKT